MAYSPFRNLWLKLISIAIAALLWLVVAGDRDVERVVRLPLEFQNLPAGLEVVTDTPDAIDARLRGPSATLGGITSVDAWAVIDLRTARPGRRLYNITAGQVNVPYGVEVVQVSPAALSLEFERTGVRVVPVKPAIEGRPADGFEITRTTVTPMAVEVMGPESALRRLEEAITEPITITGATGAVRESVTVGVFDPWVRLRVPQTASVAIDIAPLGVARTIEGVRVHVRNLRAGLETQPVPAMVTVTIRGAEEALRALTADAIEAYVDAGGLETGVHALPVRVVPGADYAASGIEPQLVTLRVTIH
jgi:YbbR domain-containing protein